MRLLVLDHHFDQDISSLREAAGESAALRVIPYDVLQWEALQVFPREVDVGFEPYARPDFEPYRRRYARRLEKLFEDLYCDWPFDAFVAPSDNFYYVRDARSACRRLGVPFLVVEKETTLAEHTMREHSEVLRRYAPPIADLRTVCSARQRDFWVRAGGDPSRLRITGQPRFDYFARPELWEPREGSAPTVLFLSYFVDAYHPSAGSGRALPVWEQQHRETEAALWELATRGWRVIIKPHPQQPFERERRRIRSDVGDAVAHRVAIAGPRDDVRRLITSTDVVVGFQSTAMFEAMAAGRPVVYAGWDEEARRLGSELLPFWEWSEAVVVASSSKVLPDLVERAHEQPDVIDHEFRRRIYEEQLGVVDGHASERVLALLREQVDATAVSRNADIVLRRARLDGRRPPLRVMRRVRRAATKVRASARVHTRVKSIVSLTRRRP